jgi:hypothetical protein
MSRLSRFKISLVLAILLALAIIPQNVQGIGVTPGRKTIDFSPNFEGTFKFTIVNNEHKQFNALIYTEGDLRDYVEVSKDLVVFTEKDESKQVEYTVKLPEKIEEPGDHWAKIVILEMPPEVKTLEGQSQVLGAVAVIHQVRVKVPYPGKFAKVEMSIEEAQPGEPVTFFVKVYNLGKEDIYKANAIIDILGPTNEKIATLETEEKGIESGMRDDFIASWMTENPGIYHAVATVNYDGKITTAEKNFAIGNLFIEVEGVTVKNFVLGGIAKFEIDVESKWNQRISNVYAEMKITDSKGDTIASFKSASIDIEPLQRATLYAYWDTEGVEKGAYDATLRLHYADKTTERKLKTYVEIDSITTEIIGVTAKAITGERPTGRPDILTPLVIILIMINAGWFVYFKRKK